VGYTLVPAWWLMVALGVVGGLGAGAIDAGINTYIATNHGESSMQWLHASWGLGVTLGPLIMTAALNLFNTWRVGYIIVGAAQLTLAVLFAFTASRWVLQTNPGQDKPHLMEYKTPLRQTLKQRGAWLSIFLFFNYTGIELTLGYWTYSLLTEARAIDPGLAGLVTGSYWASFTIGRILAGIYAKRIRLMTLLRAALLTALAGALLLWWNPAPWVSLASAALTGFAIAPIFPGLVSATPGRVSAEHTTNTIGMQISAGGLGLALLPGVAGVLAQRFSLEVIPVFLVGLILTLLTLLTLSSRR
jgi:fucose permease